MDGKTPYGKICRNLTSLHISPEGRSTMKVKLATQVLSSSVYAALSFMSRMSTEKCDGIANIVLFMDQFFDTLNSKAKSPKQLNQPLCQTTEKNIMEFWGQAKPKLSNMRFLNRDGKQVKSPPCIRHLISTIRNIQSLWTFLKGVGFTNLKTRSLNQDPLENFLVY